MKRDNRGLSLVELMIVIAILAVISGIVTLGIGVAISKPAEECARKMQQSLEGARVYTMGKQKMAMKYYMSDGAVYAQEIITYPNGTTLYKDPEKIGAKGMKVTYKAKTGGTEYNLSGTPLILSFDRSTGGLNTAECSPSGFSSQVTLEIQVQRGSTVMKVTLYGLTGKVTVE